MRRLFQSIRSHSAKEVRANRYDRRFNDGIDQILPPKAPHPATLQYWRSRQEIDEIVRFDREAEEAEWARKIAAGPIAIAGIPCFWNDTTVPNGVIRIIQKDGQPVDCPISELISA